MNQTITPEYFAAYMRGVCEFAPADGLDAVQWTLIRDMAVRVALPENRPARPQGCGCGGTNPHTHG